MSANVSIHRDELQPARSVDLGTTQRLGLAVLCLVAGIAPLAARSIHNEIEQLSYGVAIAALLLALTGMTRRSATLAAFWQLPFVFFVFAVVQVLNNAVPHLVRVHVLGEHTVSGNPLASTVSGTVVIQLLETALALVPILFLIRAAGSELGSVYWRRGRFGWAYLIAICGFVALYFLIGLSPAQRVIQIDGSVTFRRYLALTPALLVMAFSNGFQEELLFRGLFLQRYATFFGLWGANVLQALVFAIAHNGVTYTPNALVFMLVTVFPLGLLFGYLMQKSDGIVAPAILHAGFDIPIYLGFLTFVH